jgi:hypothetical protein
MDHLLSVYKEHVAPTDTNEGVRINELALALFKRAKAGVRKAIADPNYRPRSRANLHPEVRDLLVKLHATAYPAHPQLKNFSRPKAREEMRLQGKKIIIRKGGRRCAAEGWVLPHFQIV